MIRPTLLTIAALATPLFALGCASAAPPQAMAAAAAEKPIVFTAESGESVEAFNGAFTVPENRSAEGSRTLTVHYVRFPATGAKKGPPIVYLAGGPGGSGIGTAKGRRFPLFMAMRQFGDVIALDQRGTGESDETPRCVSDVLIRDDEAITPDDANRRLRQSVKFCEAFWREAGVDLKGYTTVENARDLEALRVHLGADKVTLWGISYGTHLALAALKEMPGRIDRVVLASAEGLDQTVKLPSRTNAYFGRLQAVIDADPKAKAALPDIRAMMARVNAKLDAEPVMLTLNRDGAVSDYLLQKRSMQMMASAMIADPEYGALLVQLYAAADAGDYAPIKSVLEQYFSPAEPMGWRAMPLAMDVASGIGAERLARVRREAKTALLGDLLNDPMPQLAGAIEGLDLGDDFRTAPVSDVPTLLFTATLDGRTYPGGQTEAVAGLSNLTRVTVVNAGHNLFMTTPKVTEAIEAFMRGEKQPAAILEIAPPSFGRR